MTTVSKGQVQDDDLSESEQEALSLIRKRDGIFQSELWKEMDRSSRAGSRIAQSLAEKGLISRNETTHEGRKTYKLQLPEQDSSPNDLGSTTTTNSEIQELSSLARSIVTTLEKRGETPISRIDREVNGTPAEVDEAIQELLDKEIITIGRETLYGRETDVLSFDSD